MSFDFKSIDMRPFQESLMRFNQSIVAWGKRLREKRLERRGISMGVAPGPFPDSIDISIPNRIPRL